MRSTDWLYSSSLTCWPRSIISRSTVLSYVNVVLPALAIAVIWVFAALRRRARKQSFLASVQ